MRNKILVFVVFVFLSGLFTSCNQSSGIYSKLEFVHIEADRITYYDLDSLENKSDLIIVGEIVDDPQTEPGLTYSDDFNKEILTGMNSYSTVKVKKVFAGDIREGDEIRLGHRCGVYEDQFVTFSEMTPMLKGDSWIFFLMDPLDNSGSCYYCTGDSDGRYPLKNASYCRTGLTEYEDLGVYRRDSFKDNIYNEILDKYDL